MSDKSSLAIALDKPILALSGIRALTFQVLLIAGAVILPVISHFYGAPVRFLLPMHWPVILAGLVYGWRAGTLTGALAPIISYFISGYPLPNILPSMTVELLTYGLATGFLQERVRLNPFFSVATALVLGRIVFIISILIRSFGTINNLQYFQAALVPGFIAALLQISMLPFVAKWWIKKELHSTKE